MDSPIISGEQDTPAFHKRARLQLSCNFCRRAKLRCDRGQPCSQCTKRDRHLLCGYAIPKVRQEPNKSLQSRLHHLESLVVDMMNDQVLRHESHASTSVPLITPEDSIVQSVQFLNVEKHGGSLNKHNSQVGKGYRNAEPEVTSGQVVLGMKETSYIGATHWAAILDDIEDIRSYFQDEPGEDLSLSHEIGATAMALGNTAVSSKFEILAALPDRSIVDRLVSRYFNSNDPAIIIIHKPTFQKEYQDFWTDPSKAPTAWLGLLFAILCLAAQSSIYAKDEAIEPGFAPADLAKKYRDLCSRTLVLADYTKPGPYTVQALLLYLESEFIRGGDSPGKCWVLHGLAVRVALRMGYHRDGRHYGNISAFHGEMRRRLWHLLVQVDLLLSFQIGLPNMIRARQSDTARPHNLLDDDFSEKSSELPTERPLTEPTPMSYMICKGSICHVFGMITEQANLIIPPTYEEVLELDSHLREAYALIPHFLRIRPLAQSITDSPNLIMQRFNISLLYHKSQCVLHRKYFKKGNSPSPNVYSKKSCIDSALELLRHQAELHDAIQPGAPLSRDRWFLTTIAAHDFLLGAMIIYLTLTQLHGAGSNGDSYSNKMDLRSRETQNLFEKLEISHQMWTKSPKEARDAEKAVRVLEMMLKNTRSSTFVDGDNLPVFSGGESYSRKMPSLPADHSQTLSISEPDIQLRSNLLELTNDLESMIDMPDTINWETWDSQINVPDTESLDQFWANDLAFEDVPIHYDSNMI